MAGRNGNRGGVVFAAAALGLAIGGTKLAAQEYLTGLEWPRPPVVTPGADAGAPPSDAVILFNGKDLSAWNNGEKWKVADGEAVAVPGAGEIATKAAFGDCQVHLEWSAPNPPRGEGQDRGNSGLFFGPYELQILDSYQADTYFDGQAGAIYKQTPPLVNAMRKPGDWNVYDVVFTAPKFADGKLVSPAFITALHNGVAIQAHFQLLGDTPYNRPPQYSDVGPLQIRLQDHGHPVRFRNIWVREIKPIVGKRLREPYMKVGDQETPVPQAGN